MTTLERLTQGEIKALEREFGTEAMNTFVKITNFIAGGGTYNAAINDMEKSIQAGTVAKIAKDKADKEYWAEQARKTAKAVGC